MKNATCKRWGLYLFKTYSQNLKEVAKDKDNAVSQFKETSSAVSAGIGSTKGCTITTISGFHLKCTLKCNVRQKV